MMITFHGRTAHIVAGLIVFTFSTPLLAFAHPDHPPGAPEHPADSPDFHQVDTTASAPVSIDQDKEMMQTGLLALLLELLALLQAELAAITGEDQVEPIPGDLVACTEDAFMCSDGTWVGRSGPNCEFVCPLGDTAVIETTGDLVMTTDSEYRYFKSDGLPEYSTAGNRYANSPSEQDHDFRVPLNPEMNSAPTYYELPYTFGIALNGVTFEPFAAEWYQNDRDSGWQEDPFVTLPDLDSYNAHVQPNGLYHYHGQPTNLMTGDFDTHSPVLGFAADGFPLYGPYVYFEAEDSESDITLINSSYELKSGARQSGPDGTYDGTYNEDYEYSEWGSNSLDECNGRFGVTPEYPDGTYYYVATESFPYIPRCLMGDMDPSFAAGPPGR